MWIKHCLVPVLPLIVLSLLTGTTPVFWSLNNAPFHSCPWLRTPATSIPWIGWDPPFVILWPDMGQVFSSGLDHMFLNFCLFCRIGSCWWILLHCQKVYFIFPHFCQYFIFWHMKAKNLWRGRISLTKLIVVYWRWTVILCTVRAEALKFCFIRVWMGSINVELVGPKAYLGSKFVASWNGRI